MRTASLPMYDLPEIRAATAAFWASLAGNLRRHGLADVPSPVIKLTCSELRRTFLFEVITAV